MPNPIFPRHFNPYAALKFLYGDTENIILPPKESLHPGNVSHPESDATRMHVTGR